MKRSPMPRRTEGLKRSPMKQGLSRKQNVDVAELKSIKPQVYLRSKMRCEIGFSCCEGYAAHVHHRQSRSTGDNRLENLLHVCRSCHEWGHAHPKVAREVGFIVSAIGTVRPEDVVVVNLTTGKVVIA